MWLPARRPLLTDALLKERRDARKREDARSSIPLALLAFLNREAGFEKVRTLLRTAETASEPLLMNEINVGEVFYIIAKTRPGKGRGLSPSP